MANTLSLGYYDSVKAKGTAGYIDHTKEITGVASFERAGHEIFAQDGDAILAGLHAVQGTSQTILTIGNTGIGRGVNYRPPEPSIVRPPTAAPVGSQMEEKIVAYTMVEGPGLGAALKPMTMRSVKAEPSYASLNKPSTSTAWPETGGSGPVPGAIGIADATAVKVLRNYYPKRNGMEFVYDPPLTNTFVTGRPQRGLYQGSAHEQLVSFPVK